MARMAIHRPDKVLLQHVPLSFVRSRVSGGKKKALDAAIPLVPFIDFLITLVVFLLSSFDATGVLPAAALDLPQAENASDIELAPIVAIDSRAITLDGRRIADTATMRDTRGLERIEGLVQGLETVRTNWTLLHPGEEFSGAVVVQADRSIDFRVVKHVMFSAAQAGYSNVSFAVTRTGGT